MRCVVAAKERKELKSSRKTENGLESVDEEAVRATAGARLVARVFAWDTEKSVFRWGAVVEFSRSGSGSYPGFR